jgi:hypothetical protein
MQRIIKSSICANEQTDSTVHVMHACFFTENTRRQEKLIALYLGALSGIQHCTECFLAKNAPLHSACVNTFLRIRRFEQITS